VAALLCALWLPAAAQTPAADRQRAEAAARRTADRLNALRREADALTAQERTLLVELRKLEVDRQIRVVELARIDRERADTEARLHAAEARAAELARSAEAQLPDVQSRLVQLYKLGRAGYWRLLLNADDLQALGRAYRTASTLTAMDRARVDEYYATLDALARERKALQARAAELDGLQAAAATARAALDKAVASRNALVQSIDARRDLNAQLMGELQVAQERLQASVAEMGDTPRSGTALPLLPFQGELPWPAAGSVARRFGRQAGSQPGAAVVRNGIDLRVADGQAVRAVHEGTVVFADRFAGYGNLVIVDHGGKSHSIYGYLETLEVARGATVEEGTVVGAAGRDPSGNPSVYFELRVDGAAVDPLQWLRKSR
jgi:septal ring factor EnvC (AmiA/AmiB activator)